MIEGGARLPRVEQDLSELAVAARYAPRLLFDRHEPFLPQAVGYTIFRADGYSPSFPRCIGLNPVGRQPAEVAIEYAIWWDWDINHLYELEHIWTYVDGNGRVVHAEGSWHGDFRSLRRWQDRRLPLHDDTHPIAYSQPGKHAFAPTEEPFLMIREHVRRQCNAQAEKAGLLITPVSKGLISHDKTPEADRLANAYLKTQAFEPAFAWEQTFDVAPDILIPWPALAGWIPNRIEWLLTWLQAEAQVTDYE